MQKRLFVPLALVAVTAVAGAAAWRLFGISELAYIGTGYAAQQTCACLYVSGRSLASCRTDLEPLAQRFISLRQGNAEVTAHVSGIAHAKARYETGFGCSLKE